MHVVLTWAVHTAGVVNARPALPTKYLCDAWSLRAYVHVHLRDAAACHVGCGARLPHWPAGGRAGSTAAAAGGSAGGSGSGAHRPEGQAAGGAAAAGSTAAASVGCVCQWRAGGH
jgi:hypothetical protein